MKRLLVVLVFLSCPLVAQSSEEMPSLLESLEMFYQMQKGDVEASQEAAESEPLSEVKVAAEDLLRELSIEKKEQKRLLETQKPLEAPDAGFEPATN